MQEETGGGKKKTWGKHRAAEAPYMKPGSKAVVPNDWEDNCASEGKNESEKSHCADKIIGNDVAVGPGVI
ncbi:hypothetical protein DSO57_1023874 [Entomophthora muscae]|uniref:Uncharacterized protein n=1 Tax=Entomophthora muscae TaxID=34485 RepID=A0ACC2TPS0_9FUNG|nr:hypothetical protein DSO57_1023874 [Entomophthora muscae]